MCTAQPLRNMPGAATLTWESSITHKTRKGCFMAPISQRQNDVRKGGSPGSRSSCKEVTELRFASSLLLPSELPATGAAWPSWTQTLQDCKLPGNMGQPEMPGPVYPPIRPCGELQVRSAVSLFWGGPVLGDCWRNRDKQCSGREEETCSHHTRCSHGTLA